MDLENLLPHKRNTSVLVNGTKYDIGGDGVVRNVSEKDAEKMLQNEEVWKPFDSKRREAQDARRKATAEKTRMALVTTSGKKITKEEPKATKPKEGEGGEGEPGSDPPVPAEGEEWPDPTEEMSVEYLKLMADAYEVTYAKNIGKATLIERIKAAMYEE